jgi:AcrR family transcriptional regulator
MSAHAYRTARNPGRSEATRERIKGAVRELLAEGTFHTSTVEHVADRAGISRATLYQHFRSRLELVDAICETFDANPALLEIRQIVELPDADAALNKTIANCTRFWSSEDAVLHQLYGVAAIDPAAQDLVDRQRNDRRGELERLVNNLHGTGRLRDRTTARALNLLLVLTSYETFRELREAGLSDRQLTTTLQQTAHELLLDGRGSR